MKDQNKPEAEFSETLLSEVLLLNHRNTNPDKRFSCKSTVISFDWEASVLRSLPLSVPCLENLKEENRQLAA